MRIRSVKFNFAMNLLLTASAYIFPLITFPYVSRVLQPAAYGQATYASSIVSYFSLFASLGVSMYGSRECARVREDSRALARVSEELMVLTLGTSALSLAVLYACMLLVPKLSGYTVLLAINSATVVLTTIGAEWFFRGIEQYAYITMRSLVVKTISMLALFAFVHSPSDLYAYAAISVVVNGGAYLWNFAYMLRFVGRDWLPLRELSIRRHIKPMITLFLSSAAISVYTNLDTVMLGAMAGDEAVGLYSAAVRIKSVLTSLTASLGSVIIPRASYYYASKQIDNYHRLLSISTRFALVLSVPAMCICYAFADTIILILAGDSFAGSIFLLRIVLPSVVFIGLTQITANQILLPTGKEQAMALTYATAAIVDLISNLVLIPAYGAIGASLSTTIAEFVVLFSQAVIALPEIKESNTTAGLVRLLFVLVLSSIVLPIGVGCFGNSLTSMVVVTGIYGATLLGLLILFREASTMELVSHLKQANLVERVFGKRSRLD